MDRERDRRSRRDSALRRARRRLRPPRSLRATRAGWCFVAIIFGVGFAALNTGNNLLYLVFALMLAFLVLSGVLSEASLRGIRIERHLPRELFAAATHSVVLRVHNDQRRVASFALTIEDRALADEGPRSVGRCFTLRVGPRSRVDRRYALAPERRAARADQAETNLATLPVRDLMTRDPACIGPDASAHEAAALMRDRKISCLLVTRDGLLDGIVTDGDIARGIVAAGIGGDTPVSAIMTASPVSLSPGALGFDALLAMTERGIGHMPVTDEGKPVGIITQTDLLRRQVSTDPLTGIDNRRAFRVENDKVGDTETLAGQHDRARVLHGRVDNFRIADHDGCGIACQLDDLGLVHDHLDTLLGGNGRTCGCGDPGQGEQRGQARTCFGTGHRGTP